MENNRLIEPLGDFNVNTLFDFFNVSNENKQLLEDALLDIPGLYSTIQWPTDKYYTVDIKLKKTKKGNIIYNINNENIEIKNLDYTKNSNTDYYKYNLSTILNKKINYDNETENEVIVKNLKNSINKSYSNVIKNYKKEHLINKVNFLIYKPKKYKLNNKENTFTVGSIVKSETSGRKFEFMMPFIRTLLKTQINYKKIFIYKLLNDDITKPNIYYIYSYWGEVQDYYDPIHQFLIKSICKYIEKVCENNLKNSKFIFAGHSEGGNISQHLFINLSKNKIIPNENLFLISLSYPQALIQNDIDYINNNLKGHFISLISFGYARTKFNPVETSNNNNNNSKLTKKKILNTNAVINSFAIHRSLNNNNENYKNNEYNRLKLLKTAFILFNKNNKAIALYDMNEYVKVNPDTTYGAYSKSFNYYTATNNEKKKDRKIKEGERFHVYSHFIKNGIFELFKNK